MGDELKKYQEEGTDRFKIVNKIPRKKVKGTLSKKDGRYFVLLENNKSYHLSKHAVEFRNLKQGDEVIVVIPEKDNGSDYAAIDKLAPKESNKQEKKENNSERSVQSIVNRSPEKTTQVEKNEKKIEKVEKVEFTDEDLL